MPYNASNPDIEIVVDERSALAKFKALNKAYDDFTKGVTKDASEINAAMKALESGIVNVNNRAVQSQERYLKSLERTANAYGLSGVDRLRAQRDQEIRQLGTQEAAIKRVTAAYQKMIDVETGKGSGGGGGSHGFSSPGMLALRGVKDLFEGRTAYGEVMIGRSLMGLSGTTAVIGGVAAGLGVLAAASIKAYESLGKLGVETRNAELRLGITSKQVTQFSFAAEAAGQDIGIFERMMRGLTQAAEDQSVAGDKARKWMSQFGIDIRGVRAGTVGTYEVFQQLAEGIAGITNPIERSKAELDLFKRVGIEAAPVIIELAKNLKTAREQGFGQDEASITKFKEYNENWIILKTAVGEARIEAEKYLAVVVEILARGVGKGREQGLYGMGLFGFVREGAATLAFGPPAARGSTTTLTPYGAPNPYAALGVDRQDARSDAAIRAYQLAQGPEWALKEAERKLSGVGPVDKYSTFEQVAARREAEQGVERAKDAVKFFEQHKSTIEALRKMQIEESERLAHPYGMLKADQMLKTFAEMPGGPDVEAARRTLAPLRALEAAQIQQKAIAVAREGAERAAIATGLTGEAKSPEQLSQQIRDRQAASSRAFEDEQKRQESQRAEAQRITVDMLREQRRSEEAAGLAAARISTTLAPDTVENRLADERRVAEVRLRFIDEEYRENVESAKAVYASELQLEELRLKHVHEVAAVQAQFDEARAGEIRRQLDEIKGVSKGLFDTLFTHPSQFGAQLGTTLRSAVLSPITSGLGDLTSRALHPLIFGQTGTGGIAGSLRGIFGGSTVPIGTTVSNPVYTYTVNLPPAGFTAGSPYQIGPSDYGSLTSGQFAIRNYMQHGTKGTVSQPIGGAAMMAMISGLSFAGGGGGGGGGQGGASPLGQVQYGSSDITGLTDSAIFGGGIPGAPGGTSGFSGPYSYSPLGPEANRSTPFWPGALGGGGTGSGSIPSMLRGFSPKGLGATFGNLKGMFGIGEAGGSGWGASTQSVGMYGDTISTGGTTLGSIASSPAAGVAGMFLAQKSLMPGGDLAGTPMGILGGAAGGALIGAQFGGPMGALIGAGVGAGIGLGEYLAGVEPQWREAERLVKQMYGITINKDQAKRIVSIAQQSYGNRVSIAVRAPEVRQMLGLYAAGTGQSLAPSASPHGAGLVESGGSLYQSPVYEYGRAYSYQSQLPTYGGSSTQIAGGGGASNSGPTYVALHIDGQGVAPFLDGNYFTADRVQGRVSQAWAGSQGRTQNAMALTSPGDIIS